MNVTVRKCLSKSNWMDDSPDVGGCACCGAETVVCCAETDGGWLPFALLGGVVAGLNIFEKTIKRNYSSCASIANSVYLFYNIHLIWCRNWNWINWWISSNWRLMMSWRRNWLTFFKKKWKIDIFVIDFDLNHCSKASIYLVVVLEDKVHLDLDIVVVEEDMHSDMLEKNEFKKIVSMINIFHWKWYVDNDISLKIITHCAKYEWIYLDLEDHNSS